MGKNLEAQNEVYKGLFRTPFAFLLGGPFGLAVNTTYTAIKVKNEIKGEIDHKKYLESIVKHTPTLKEYYDKLDKEEKEKEKTQKLLVDFFYLEFQNGHYVNEDEKYFMFSDLKGGVFRKDAQSMTFSFSGKNPMRGIRYRIESFAEQYYKDKLQDNIKEVYIFRHGQAAFGYCDKNNKMICTNYYFKPKY